MPPHLHLRRVTQARIRSVAGRRPISARFLIAPKPRVAPAARALCAREAFATSSRGDSYGLDGIPAFSFRRGRYVAGFAHLYLIYVVITDRTSRVARRRPISAAGTKPRVAPAARAVTAREAIATSPLGESRRRDGLLALCLSHGRCHQITRVAAGEEQREAEDGARVGSHPSN